jgi:hypothetical protein
MERMDRVMPTFAEPDRVIRREAFVDEQPHAIRRGEPKGRPASG